MIVENLIDWLEENNIFGKKNLKDFMIRDDGHGIYIKKWNIDEIEKPENLNQFKTVNLNKLKKSYILNVGNNIFQEGYKKYPQHEQINAALGLCEAEEKTEIVNFINEKILEYKEKKELIKRCRSVEELNQLGFNL